MVSNDRRAGGEDPDSKRGHHDLDSSPTVPKRTGAPAIAVARRSSARGFAGYCFLADAVVSSELEPVSKHSCDLERHDIRNRAEAVVQDSEGIGPRVIEDGQVAGIDAFVDPRCGRGPESVQSPRQLQSFRT
jgi:hypothetical protein